MWYGHSTMLYRPRVILFSLIITLNMSCSPPTSKVAAPSPGILPVVGLGSGGKSEEKREKPSEVPFTLHMNKEEMENGC